MLQTIGADHYIDFRVEPQFAPATRTKPLFVRVSSATPLLSANDITATANAAPGSTWYVGGEPNVGHSVDQLIEDFRYYYEAIRLADPTAIITSPSILNWSFTCVGCGGYTSGQAWITQFVDRYQDLYGELPSWDVWAIDLYPIDWNNLPNTGFSKTTIDEFAPHTPPGSRSIAAEQIVGLRSYIDSLPGRSGDPILITELGLHWSYDLLSFDGCSSGKPDGNFHGDVMIDYFDAIYGWLEQNSQSLNIQRWYTYVTYKNVGTCLPDGYGGVTLFAADGIGTPLTEFGEWYKVRSNP